MLRSHTDQNLEDLFRLATRAKKEGKMDQYKDYMATIRGINKIIQRDVHVKSS